MPERGKLKILKPINAYMSENFFYFLLTCKLQIILLLLLEHTIITNNIYYVTYKAIYHLCDWV